ncbi:putative oxidoreductase YjmC [bioreactor metagenome]|uniref:Putative oxidoreductase YjmC n=1 Tax=bioreactor metagenome TaxID=1076179 RepID=A0A645G8Q0_9ZZZZ
MAIGNNPFSVVVPACKHKSICADMATSMVALGKVLDYRLKNQPLPDGWAIDENGTPTNDSNAAKHLLPFAAHKGYGIAVILEVFCSILSGGDFGKSINSMYGNIDKPNNLSHCFMALRIDAFRDLEQFKADVDAFIDYLHAIPAAAGHTILMPGEIEHNNKVRNQKEGIDLPENLITELAQIAESLGVDDLQQYFR